MSIDIILIEYWKANVYTFLVSTVRNILTG
jgi:hypothetical protein